MEDILLLHGNHWPISLSFLYIRVRLHGFHVTGCPLVKANASLQEIFERIKLEYWRNCAVFFLHSGFKYDFWIEGLLIFSAVMVLEVIEGFIEVFSAIECRR